MVQNADVIALLANLWNLTMIMMTMIYPHFMIKVTVTITYQPCLMKLMKTTCL